MPKRKAVTYKDAGVNIDEAGRAVGRIKKHARSTFGRGVLTDIGTFGAGYRLSGWKSPVLVSSADGVGTKLKVAFMTGRHDTVGEDLVNHCVNDIAVQGARPLFFLDYFAVGKLDAEVAEQVVSGLARGCRANGCALIGGETAEMPGFYCAGRVRPGGLHRRRRGAEPMISGRLASGAATCCSGCPRPACTPTAIRSPASCCSRWPAFARSFRAASGLHRGRRIAQGPSQLSAGDPVPPRKGLLKGAAHITGGGITDNTPRMLPAGLAVEIDTGAWKIPPVFELLRSLGNIPEDDYRRTFNLGIGMILAVSAAKAARGETPARSAWARGTYDRPRDCDAAGRQEPE